MSKSSDTIRSISHRLGVAGPARVRAFQGAGAPTALRCPLTRMRGIVPIFLIAILGTLLLFSASAQAVRPHVFSKYVGSKGPAVGQLELATKSGIAIDQVTGGVYVADTGNHRVDEFNAKGEFVLMFGKEVNETEVLAAGSEAEQNVCTAKSLDTCQPGTSGAKPGEFEDPAFVAVDNSCFLQEQKTHTKLTSVKCKELDPSNGDVYVGDTGDVLVSKFSAEGALVTSWGVEGQLGTTPFQVATGTGNIKAGSIIVTGVTTTSGEFEQNQEITGEGIPAGTFVPNTGEVAPGFLELTNPATETKEHVALTAHQSFSVVSCGGCLTLGGIAVDASGDLWVANSNGSLFEFDQSAAFIQEGQEDRGEIPPGISLNPDVAVDPATNERYDDLGESIERTSSTGTFVETFGSPELSGGAGLAVAADASETVYAASTTAGTIDVYELQPASAPAVGSESDFVSDVSATSATLGGAVDPQSLPGEPDTEYAFEYGACPSLAACASSGYEHIVPVPDGVLAPSFEVEAVSEHVQGLLVGTAYHFRVRAENEVSKREEKPMYGSELTFTTQRTGGAFALPDGREWELVTPPVKRGATIVGLAEGWPAGAGGEEPFVAEAAADGDAMVDLASAPTEAEPQGNSNNTAVLSTRGPSGWSSQVIAPPHDEGTGPSVGSGSEYQFFSEDLSRALLRPFGGFTPLSPEATEEAPYVRTNFLRGNVDERCESSCYQPLVTASNTPAGTVFGEEVASDGKACYHLVCGPPFIDATPDLSHVVLKSQVGPSDLQLTSTPNQGELYEWSGGKLQPLYLLPNDEAGPGGVDGEGVSAGPELSPLEHQLSDDGSVFFVYNNHLYLHDFAKDESVRLDVAQGVAEPSEGDAEFLYASSDGTRVLFSDSKQLTKAAGGGIYECRVVEAAGRPCELELTGLSGHPARTTPRREEIEGSLIGGSEDASYLYFLGAGEKLIVDHYNGREWTTTEGPVVPERSVALEEGNNGYRYSGFMSPWATNQASDRVSPNGRYLAFMSYYDLTGYSTRDAVSGQLDEEVYLYDASSNRLVCASCNPTGARPVGVEYEEESLVGGALGPFSEKRGDLWVASNLPPWTRAGQNHHEGASEALYEPRYLSDSGRLFFDSNDALVPKDVNGTQDVYEYEPEGIESPEGKVECSEGTSSGSEVYVPQEHGCVALISAGTSKEESAFLDASESGGDVFFLTTSKLSSQDVEGGPVVYDAHECTSAAPCYPTPVARPPECTTEASCKAAPTPQPGLYGPPPSATFVGPGNLAAPPSSVKVKTAAEVRAEQLAKALKSCKKDKKKSKRQKCEKQAGKQYGVAKKAKKASNYRRAK